tara:strand:- start:31941 stop:33566 length:1626 start_codon:yes stop_codon:yes gene_type:complete
MTNIGSFTYLEYTIVPSPLITGQTQDIIILATLKTSVQNGGTLSSVKVKNIVLDFGGTGSAATDLTTTANEITVSDFEKNPNWKFETGGGAGTSFKVSPSSSNINHGTITSNTIMIKINDVLVNDTPGNATVTITETVSEVNGKAVTSGTVNDTSLVLPKVQTDHSQVTFTANPDHMNAGNKTTLSWNAPNDTGAVFELKYLMEDQLIKIKKHQNGNLLTSDDQYPKSSDNDLILGETTIFILSITSNGSTKRLAFPVIVSQADIYANQATIPNYQGGNFNFLDGQETLLKISGDGGSTTVTINTDQGTNSWTNLVLQNKSGAWTIGTSNNYEGNELYIHHPGGARMTLSSNGDLNINGNLTVGGNIKINGRGGRNFVDTLSSSNGFKLPNVFTNAGYRYYEFIFNSPTPQVEGDQTFGARFYVNGNVQSQNTYYTNLYGNDAGGNTAESHQEDYLSLYPWARSGPTTALGLIGSMALFNQITLGCTANIYAPNTYNSSGCQVWVEGGMNPKPGTPFSGIEFDFYSGDGIFGGYIDVYGWN